MWDRTVKSVCHQKASVIKKRLSSKGVCHQRVFVILERSEGSASVVALVLAFLSVILRAAEDLLLSWSLLFGPSLLSASIPRANGIKSSAAGARHPSPGHRAGHPA